MPSTFIEIAGYRAKVRIGTINIVTASLTSAQVLYNIQKAIVTNTVKTGDTTHFEGGGYTEEIDTVEHCEVELMMATYDATHNLFATPVLLGVRAQIRLEIFPNTITSSPWLFNRFMITELKHEPEAGGLQPITMKGVAIGPFTRPAV